MLLRRYIQEKLWYARRKVFLMMQQGRILLNNSLITDFSCLVQHGDVLLVDGKEYLVLLDDVVKQLIAFHKPIGYVVSTSDPHNKTIYQLLPARFSSYRYIGRLDKDSRGLLLLSNDLDLVQRLTHPSYAGEKVYELQLDNILSQSAIDAALSWVRDGDDMLSAIAIFSLGDSKYRVTLQEGKNRHIRRMFAVLWYEVLDLCRIVHGGYVLGDLQESEWRFIPI
jgi:23S rRNA pseudouridine2605 synthase